MTTNDLQAKLDVVRDEAREFLKLHRECTMGGGCRVRVTHCADDREARRVLLLLIDVAEAAYRDFASIARGLPEVE